MKLGILGTGMIVKDLMTTIDKLDIESIYLLGTENTKEETEELKNKYNLDKTYYDYDELLASDVDTIYVALPNHLHYIFSKKALEANKHVIIEKPITSNYKELRELKRIADEKGLIILEAMNIHYMPAYKEVKNNIDKLGKLKIVSLNYSQYSSRYNAFKEGNILPAFDYTKSGGALMDLNVYNIHFVIGLFGRPVDVMYYPNIERNIDTSGMLVLDYKDFKVITIGAKDCKAPVVSSLQGDKANIVVETPVNVIRAFTMNHNNGTQDVFEFEDNVHRMYYEFKEFIRIISELDIKTANEMLEISSIVSETMEKARKTGGIVFDADKD